MARSRFYNEIKTATIERQVEDVYNKGLGIYFPNSPISYPFDCDGYLEDNNIKLLVEYKFDKNFENGLDRAKVILQVIYYIKSFERNGRELPNVVLIADRNECFVLHTNSLIKYLDYDIDWKIAPSTASEKNIDLCIEISRDSAIMNCYIFDVNDVFSFKNVADKIKDCADDVVRYIHITEENIVPIFEDFCKRVLPKKHDISANDLVGLFIGIITDKINYYIHPNKKNLLISPYGEIKVKNDGYNAFISHFSREYTPIEKRKFTELCDRLIEDTNRRNKGEFYTPKLFVDYAHKMIEKYLGADWKERFVVWDNCAGTKNLTKDYNFNELYCSTLENAELEMSAKYNTNSVAFQFDFLNDSLDNIPMGLKNALEQNKPIVFLINPPYATANNMGTSSTSKKGVAKTMINEQMLNDNIGACSQNLYAQFLYRILLIKKQYNLTNCHIALFCKPNFLSGTTYKSFRQHWLNEFSFTDGVLFNASHFDDCSDKWGINFSIWNCGVSTNKIDFIHTLIDVENNHIIEIGKKNIYNVDYSTTASDWAKKDIKGLKTYDAPQLSSGIKVKQEGRGKLCKNSLGYYVNVGNNIYKNLTDVFLLTCTSSMGNGISITDNNFDAVVTSFTARKLIIGNWINDKDEYIAPNTDHENWRTFVADSVVYSLFNTSSNQSSLRQIDYKGNKWDIKNEFFFMSREQMMNLANENDNDDLYNDCLNGEDRFVYRWLQEHSEELSPMAKSVLDKAIELVISSMKYRPIFNEDNEQYQINNWDCSWYQIKAMLKVYMPNELKEFNELYKAFAEQLRPMVYELGFLK